MNKNQYINYLIKKGYRRVNEDQMSMGTLLFDITQTTRDTAMGKQTGFCLKLSPKSDLNLCPNPWH